MILAALLILPASAQAEQATDAILDKVGFSGLERLLGGETGIDLRTLVRKLAAGESLTGAAEWRGWAKDLWNDARRRVLRQAAILAAPSLLCGILAALLGGRSRAVPALRLVCCAACAGILANWFAEARASAEGLMTLSARAADVLAPVLISAAALTGAGEAAAGLTPVSSLCAAVIERALSGVGLKLCAALAALAAVGGLSESLRTDRLFHLGKRAALWLGGIVAAAFMGLMTLEGLLASGRGGTASRAAHYALESLVPIIGGEVSEAMETLLASARLVKSAVGVTGMLSLILASAGPLSRIGAAALAAKLAGAVAGMAGEARVAKVAEQFGDALSLLLALCLAAVLMVLMLAGGILSLKGAG